MKVDIRCQHWWILTKNKSREYTNSNLEIQNTKIKIKNKVVEICRRWLNDDTFYSNLVVWLKMEGLKIYVKNNKYNNTNKL